MRRIRPLAFVAPLLIAVACHDVTAPPGPAGASGARLVTGPGANALSGSWETRAPMPAARAYVATGEPMGKAGAYAVQGRAALHITAIQGSYSGIMGLPIRETALLLRCAGIKI